jgi:Asp-tRNA(Asn)/Glu-tRNA(Gln) amidotransferase A subunit family amidase
LPGLDLWEPHIHAFVAFDALSGGGTGPLAGLTAGVKDIIDVAGLPTRNGSAACADAAPAAADAVVVARLRAAGARIAGKTVTTEFAFTDPTDCRNPHDLTRSPGGSSSGSGAAVAAGLVDFALGTQTAGSLCRPAAYCGVVGLKPTYGALPMQGVTPLAPSFDSIGVIARSVAMARDAFAVMSGQSGAPESADMSVTCWLPSDEARATPESMQALEAAMQALRGCVRPVATPPVDCDATSIVGAHRTVMLAEAAVAHGHLLDGPSAPVLRPKFRAGLEEGRAFDTAQVRAARESLARATERFWRDMAGVDVVLTLPVPEGAPLIGDSTGYQAWLTVWTVLGGPLVSLPWGLDRLGRPLAVMLAGRPGADLPLLALAERLEVLAPPIPAPVPPTP